MRNVVVQYSSHVHARNLPVRVGGPQSNVEGIWTPNEPPVWVSRNMQIACRKREFFVLGHIRPGLNARRARH